ncbi:MAG: hypothetical protein LBF74_10270 [Treponema sp.]|jgi:hypothetical protein|nr:hypothetical protein [Treponema sp.]
MKAEALSRRIVQAAGLFPLPAITVLIAGVLLRPLRPRRTGLLLFLFLPSAAVFSQTQQVLPLSSPLYDEMDALYALYGLAAPSAARPWTNAEAAGMLQRLDQTAGVGAAAADSRVQDLYDRIAAELSVPFTVTLDNLAALNLQLDAALEAYAHTNSRDFVLEEDWRYGYEERKPLLSLTLELRIASWFYVTSDLRYGRNRFNERDMRRDTADLSAGVGAVVPPPDAEGESCAFPYRSWAYGSPFITNVTTGFDEFDFDWPKRANLTAGGKHWNLSIARDRVKWGPGRTGNFVFDDHRDYDEYLQFSAFTDNFKYQWLNVFYALPGFGGTGGFKFLMAHRLEFRILPALVFAVSENLMVDPDGFGPANANPAFIYHNWYDRSRFNAIAQLELDYVPAAGWRLYTETVIDQFRAFWEDESEPASWGILGGLEHTRFAGPGLLILSLEGAYTSPLLYRRDQVDFLTVLPVKVNGSKDNLVFDYTGYPYGGDALVLRLDSRYRFPGGALVSAGFFGAIHGRMNPFVSHNRDGNNGGLANREGSTPSGSNGEQELSCGVSIRGAYTLAKKMGIFTISAWAGADFVIKKNKLMISEAGQGEDIIYHNSNAVTDLQVVFGIGLRL